MYPCCEKKAPIVCIFSILISILSSPLPSPSHHTIPHSRLTLGTWISFHGQCFLSFYLNAYTFLFLFSFFATYNLLSLSCIQFFLPLFSINYYFISTYLVSYSDLIVLHKLPARNNSFHLSSLHFLTCGINYCHKG